MPTSGWHRKRPNAASRQRQHEYNSTAYRQAGKAAERHVATGDARCWRCAHRFPPTAKRGVDWQLGHDDDDRRVIRGPECTGCNLRAAARKGARMVNRTGSRRAQSRAW